MSFLRIPEFNGFIHNWNLVFPHQFGGKLIQVVRSILPLISLHRRAQYSMTFFLPLNNMVSAFFVKKSFMEKGWLFVRSGAEFMARIESFNHPDYGVEFALEVNSAFNVVESLVGVKNSKGLERIDNVFSAICNVKYWHFLFHGKQPDTVLLMGYGCYHLFQTGCLGLKIQQWGGGVTDYQKFQVGLDLAVKVTMSFMRFYQAYLVWSKPKSK